MIRWILSGVLFYAAYRAIRSLFRPISRTGVGGSRRRAGLDPKAAVDARWREVRDREEGRESSPD